MKSATFNSSRPFLAGASIWQLTQTFWVGGLVLLHLAILTVLDQTGLIPLLIHGFVGIPGALLVGFAGLCAMMQMAVLIRIERASSIWRDVRGRLLLVALFSAISFYGLRHWLPDAVHWLLMSYLFLGLAGLLLVLQPVPGRGNRAR
ncbi:MFS transporter [Pseudomonas caspiana]